MSSDHEIATTKLPLAPFRLSDIRIHEIKVERCDDHQADDEIEFQLVLKSSKIDSEDNSFFLKLMLQTQVPDGKDSVCNLELSIEGRFEAIVDIKTLREDVIDDFRSRTGLFLMWPYLRQHLHDLTNRLRLEVPPLPLIDMSSSSQEEIDETQAPQSDSD
jgi:preprotein translocase subunit SecB